MRAKPSRRTEGRSRRTLLGTMVGALLLGGCATKGDLRDLRTEIDDLARRQERALASLQEATRANQDSISAQSELLFELRGDVLQELLSIQDQLVSIGELTGQNQRSLTSLRDRIETQRTLLASAAPEGDSLEGDTSPAAGTTEGPEEIFNAALTLFNRGSNNTARRGFEQFLLAYPNDERAGDANYYLADILVQESRLDEAIDGFMRIHELYPSSPRVPDALYRAGVLHLELGNDEQARRLLEMVVNSYADSPAARLAEERLADVP